MARQGAALCLDRAQAKAPGRCWRAEPRQSGWEGPDSLTLTLALALALALTLTRDGTGTEAALRGRDAL